MRITAPLASAILLAFSPALAAQTPTLWSDATAPDTPAPRLHVARLRTPAPPAVLLGTGLLTAAGSVFAGGYVGVVLGEALSSCEYCEMDGLGGAILGAFLLPAIATPLAVHLVNDGAGSLGGTLGVSLLTAVVTGAALLGSIGSNSGLNHFLLIPPAAEIVASVTLELATTRRSR